MALNEDMSDRIIARALMLQRFKASETRKVLALLKEMESELIAEIQNVDPSGAVRPTFRQRRALRLIEQSREMIRAGYSVVRSSTRSGLISLAREESNWFMSAANSEIGVPLVTTELSFQQIRAIASDTLINGAPSSEWWSRQAGATQRRFGDAVRQGMLQGETTEQITTRIRGTRAQGFSDGIMQASRAQARTLVQTSVQTVANAARDMMYEENQDVVDGIQWVSTLDQRTTEICMALHGKAWKLPDYEPIGHDMPFPGPTAHFNCRSTQVSVFKSFRELAKDRSVKTEDGGRSDARSIFERNLRERGWSEDKIREATFNARSSMDGQIPREKTFDQFLKGKSPAFQNEALGRGKADLWRQGKIGLGDLVDQSNRPLTLEQLRNTIDR